MPKVVEAIEAKVEMITVEKEGNFGPYRSVLFKRGEEKIWQSFDPDSEELQILKRGMRVQLVPRGESKSGRTQYNIVLLDVPTPNAPPPAMAISEGGMLTPEQKRECAAYVEQMAKLYRYCFEQAHSALTDADKTKNPAIVESVNPATIQAAASTLFIAAQRKFGV